MFLIEFFKFIAAQPKKQKQMKVEYMKKTILALAVVAGLTSFTGTVKAGLTFDFSFTDLASSTISGVLTLNDANTSAQSLYITSTFGLTPIAFNQGFNYVFTDPQSFMYDVSANSFTVSDGNITSANFWGSGYGSYGNIQLNTSFSGDYYNYYYYDNVGTGNGPVANLAGITFTPAAVPEPSTFALFGLGALGLGMAMRRKKTA